MNPQAEPPSTGNLRGDRSASAMNAAPVRPLEQGAQLRRRQPHHAVLDTRPLQPAGLQLLGHQAQPGAIPPDVLDPVTALGPEHVDHAGIGIAALLGTDQRSQGIGAFAEIHRACGDHDLRTCSGSDHRVARSASITAAITPASAPRLIFTATPSISSSTALAFERRRFFGRWIAGAGSSAGATSITVGTNAGAAAPWLPICLRNCRRQVTSCDGLMPCRRATEQAVSCPEKLSARIDALTSGG